MTINLPFPSADTYQQWAQDLIAYMDQQGYTIDESQSNINAISAQEQAEAPVSQMLTNRNPLNTSRTTDVLGNKLSSGLEPGSSFIPAFPTLLAGVEANAATIEQGNYASMLSALEGGNASATWASDIAGNGVGESAWGTSPTLVASILGTGASTSAATPSDPSTNSGSSTQPATGSAPGGKGSPRNLTGVGAGLQEFDQVLNALTVPLGGAAGTIESAIIEIVGRALTAAIFLGITYLGIKLLFNRSSNPSIVETVQAQQRIGLSRERLGIQQGELEVRQNKLPAAEVLTQGGTNG